MRHLHVLLAPASRLHQTKPCGHFSCLVLSLSIISYVPHFICNTHDAWPHCSMSSQDLAHATLLVLLNFPTLHQTYFSASCGCYMLVGLINLHRFPTSESLRSLCLRGCLGEMEFCKSRDGVGWVNSVSGKIHFCQSCLSINCRDDASPARSG